MAFTTFQGGTTADKFLNYLKEILISTLRPGDIVVMDNLRTHHVQAVGELLRDAGAEAIYLPAYSPDLNPIEKLWFKSLFNISTCMDWRVDFLPCKAKIRRHPDGWQGFLTQSGRKIRRQDMRGEILNRR